MHERLSVNTLCFPNAGFDKLSGYWRELGARRVSLVGNLLEGDGVSAARAALADGPYQLETVVEPFLPYNCHVDPREETWHEPRARFIRFIDEVKGLGAQSIYTVTGGFGKLSWEEAADVFSAAIAPCLAHAKECGIPLMVENTPQLYAHTHIGNSLRDAVTLAEISGVGICMDLFGCWTEAGLQNTIKRAVPRCHIVQVCDYVFGDRSLPARAVPGDGAIPLVRILDWILSAGYTGRFDLEMMGPRIDTEGHLAAVRRATDTVGEILNYLGA